MLNANKSSKWCSRASFPATARLSEHGIVPLAYVICKSWVQRSPPPLCLARHPQKAILFESKVTLLETKSKDTFYEAGLLWRVEYKEPIVAAKQRRALLLSKAAFFCRRRDAKRWGVARLNIRRGWTPWNSCSPQSQTDAMRFFLLRSRAAKSVSNRLVENSIRFYGGGTDSLRTWAVLQRGSQKQRVLSAKLKTTITDKRLLILSAGRIRDPRSN